jgi:hypothetical protein
MAIALHCCKNDQKGIQGLFDGRRAFVLTNGT